RPPPWRALLWPRVAGRCAVGPHACGRPVRQPHGRRTRRRRGPPAVEGWLALAPVVNWCVRRSCRPNSGTIWLTTSRAEPVVEDQIAPSSGLGVRAPDRVRYYVALPQVHVCT